MMEDEAAEEQTPFNGCGPWEIIRTLRIGYGRVAQIGRRFCTPLGVPKCPDEEDQYLTDEMPPADQRMDENQKIMDGEVDEEQAQPRNPFPCDR